MKLSSIITPFPIYSEFYDQDRFKKDCDEFCDYELITDKEALLPFQFRRDASIYPFTKIWLRPACVNFYNKLIADNAANFITGTGWSVLDATISSHAAKLTYSTGGFLAKNYLLTNGNKYVAKFTVSERKQTGSFTLNANLFNGGTPLLAITTTGTFEVPFTASSTDISINTLILGVDDYLTISKFQVYEIIDFDTDLNDYQLPNNMAQIVNLGTQDLINYCGDNLSNTLPCGKYYIIFKSKDSGGNDEYFFSEVIEIKNFIRAESPYVLLEWYSECDVQDVKYTELECNYKNRLYVDGPVTTPEYPFTEEGEEDGDKNFNPIFQKWEKKTIIIIPKAPEFIVDATTCIRLHDVIQFYPALRKNQDSVDANNPVVIKSLTYEIKYIFQDCAANIDLKCLLEGNIVDSACCTPIAVPEQPACCNYTVQSVGYYDIDMPPPAVALDMDGLGALTLYQLNFDTDQWEVVDPLTIAVNTIVCTSETNEHYFWNGSLWKLFPKITGIVDNGTYFTITGDIPSNTMTQITVTYDGNTFVLPGVYSASELASGININYTDVPMTPVASTTMTATISCFNAYCDYGDSGVYNLVFGE